VPLTTEAGERFDDLARAKTFTSLLVKDLLPVPEATLMGGVICAHLTASQQWQTVVSQLRAHHQWAIRFVSLGAGKEFQTQVRQTLGKEWAWREMRHRALGGLSNARVWVGWSGTGRPKRGLCIPKHPNRPLDRFLEPSVKLDRWSRRLTRPGCWRPMATDAEPFIWPWDQNEPWVEAPTCLLGKRPLGECNREPVMVQRPLTVKELGQIFDVREDWGGRVSAAFASVGQWREPPSAATVGNGNGCEGVADGACKGKRDGRNSEESF
jgi:hypothetical protein